MRVSQVEMDQSHQRIVKGASRLMRKRGIETTSVNDVMKKAGLTHGGFYRHFDSKESLVSAALADAFTEVLDMVEKSYEAFGSSEGAEEYYKHYLSEGHVKHPELGCPIAALSLDVSRSPNSVKKTYSAGFSDAVEKLAFAEEGTVEEKRAAATRKLCMLAGAVMIARAADAETARTVLAACADGALSHAGDTRR